MMSGSNSAARPEDLVGVADGDHLVALEGEQLVQLEPAVRVVDDHEHARSLLRIGGAVEVESGSILTMERLDREKP